MAVQAEEVRVATILNVNENDGARYMSTLMLQKSGFQVVEAKDGASALELARLKPDVVVLDVRLPDISGFEVCRCLKANPETAGIKVLLTSATFVTLDNKVEGIEVGADGYLTQPFEPEELAATVQSLVRLNDAEGRLRVHAEHLVDAGRRKDEFLAMLGHELRNPLAAISASVPLLQQGPPRSPAELRARDVISRQLAHLSRLVDDLLDVSRVTSGNIELRKEPVELVALLTRVATSCREVSVAGRAQTLDLVLPETEIHVFGDTLRLEQVFNNLLENASKYTDHGGTLSLSVSALSSHDGGSVRVVIRDSGIGIAPAALSTIFGLFSQADVPIDRSRGGLGIGLTLVKKLVELHGGSVFARSQGLGEGSEFEVQLPALTQMQVLQYQRTSSSDPEPNPAIDLRRRRLVLVEDNLDAQQALSDLCSMWGHEVRVASDGSGGVTTILAELPDIALVDIGLPNLNGYEVARAVRSDPRATNVFLVALTGYGSPDQKKLALESGFDLHLTKPVDPERLERLLQEVRRDSEEQQVAGLLNRA